jgi:hypothetical protein
MSEADILMPIVGGLMSILIIVIGWMGNKLHERLGEINETLATIDRDLRFELNRLDNRLTVVETKISK